MRGNLLEKLFPTIIEAVSQHVLLTNWKTREVSSAAQCKSKDFRTREANSMTLRLMLKTRGHGVLLVQVPKCKGSRI